MNGVNMYVGKFFYWEFVFVEIRNWIFSGECYGIERVWKVWGALDLKLIKIYIELQFILKKAKFFLNNRQYEGKELFQKLFWGLNSSTFSEYLVNPKISPLFLPSTTSKFIHPPNLTCLPHVPSKWRVLCWNSMNQQASGPKKRNIYFRIGTWAMGNWDSNNESEGVRSRC